MQREFASKLTLIDLNPKLEDLSALLDDAAALFDRVALGEVEIELPPASA